MGETEDALRRTRRADAAQAMQADTSKFHVLVTGSSGIGKTDLTKYFKDRGFNAEDADICGIGVWLDKEGNGFHPSQDTLDAKKIHVWASERGLRWIWDGERLKDLLNRNPKLYLLGGASNMREFTPLFDWHIYLQADADLILERVNRRNMEGKSHHTFGSTEEQRARILGDLEPSMQWARSAGFTFIDASPPTEKIFQEICCMSEEKQSAKHKHAYKTS